MHAAHPLTGTTVLDLSQGVAAPYCSGLCAELDARMIKVRPQAGDWIAHCEARGKTMKDYP